MKISKNQSEKTSVIEHNQDSGIITFKKGGVFGEFKARVISFFTGKKNPKVQERLNDLAKHLSEGQHEGKKLSRRSIKSLLKGDPALFKKIKYGKELTKDELQSIKKKAQEKNAYDQLDKKTAGGFKGIFRANETILQKIIDANPNCKDYNELIKTLIDEHYDNLSHIFTYPELFSALDNKTFLSALTKLDKSFLSKFDNLPRIKILGKIISALPEGRDIQQFFKSNEQAIKYMIWQPVFGMASRNSEFFAKLDPKALLFILSQIPQQSLKHPEKFSDDQKSKYTEFNNFIPFLPPNTDYQAFFKNNEQAIKDISGPKINDKVKFQKIVELFHKNGFPISDNYKLNPKLIHEGPDPSMEKWNVLIEESHQEISDEKWESAKEKLVKIAEKFNDKITVGGDVKASTLVNNFFALVLKVQDAKTSAGKNYIKQRLCAMVDYISDPKNNISEDNLKKIIELFADGAIACPDRAIVFLEKAEIQLKLIKSPEHFFNILFNSFKRQMIELTFLDFNNKENIETILYQLNRFNELLHLGAQANMLYEHVAKKGSFLTDASKLLQAFNKDALVAFFLSFPEVEEMLGVKQDANAWSDHILDLQAWADPTEDAPPEISGKKLEAFVQFFKEKFPEKFEDKNFETKNLSDQEKLKEIIANEDQFGGDCVACWNNIYNDKNDLIHKEPNFKAANLEEKLLEKLAEAGILIPQ